MPSRPRAPATPAPTTAEGYEAPPVDEAWALAALGALDALPAVLPGPVVVDLREAECTEEMVVVLRKGEIVALMKDWMLDMGAAVAVPSEERR